MREANTAGKPYFTCSYTLYLFDLDIYIQKEQYK